MTTININLLPEELRARPSGPGGADMPSKEAMVPIGIGVAVALVICLLPTALTSLWLEPRAAAAQEEQESIDREIAKYNTTLKNLKSIGQKKETLRKQLSTLQSVAGGRTSWAEMLNELRSMTPGNLWFESVRSDSTKGTLQISGGALDYTSVAYFHRNLQHSDYFMNPVLSNTEMTKNQGGTTVVTFTLDLAIKQKP